MHTKLLAAAVVLATLFTPTLAGITTATAQGQAGGTRMTPPPGGAMFAPSKARTITFRQNGVLIGTFAVPEGVAVTLQSDGPLNRPSDPSEGTLTTNGSGEIRFLRAPFVVEDAPASLSFRNTEVTITVH
jgi:hypothetical protein